MIKKWKYFVAVTIIGITLFSCGECEDGTCYGFTESLMTYAPYPASTNQLVFENDSNQTLEFNFNRTFKTPEKVQICEFDGMRQCECRLCRQKEFDILFETPDSSRIIYDTSGTFIFHVHRFLRHHIIDKIKEENHAYAYLKIFDAHIYYDLYPSVKYNPEDTLLTTFTAGSTTYNNVLVHHIDTQTVFNGRYIIKPFVQRVYYNHEFGLIAFYDIETSSIFYRKP